MRGTIAWILVVVAAVGGTYLRMDHVHQKELSKAAELNFAAGELQERWHQIYALESGNRAILFNAKEQAERRVGHSDTPAAAGCETQDAAFRGAVDETLGYAYVELKERSDRCDVASPNLRGFSRTREVQKAAQNLETRHRIAASVRNDLEHYCKERDFEVKTEFPQRWSSLWY